MRKLSFCIVFIFLSALSVHTQTVSDKKDIAVFMTATKTDDVPAALYEAVDDTIMHVFRSMDRFTVIAVEERYTADSVDEFIRTIRQNREQNAEIPEAVYAGKQALTKDDWLKLVSAYVIVMPAFTEYELSVLQYEWVDTDYDGYVDTLYTEYAVKYTVQFILLNMETEKMIGTFSLKHSGAGKSVKKALNQSLLLLADDLEFNVRKIPEFRIKTGITDIAGKTVSFELGKNRGISVGDEFALMEFDTDGGTVRERENGLLMVTEVNENASKALLLYSDGEPTFAEQLAEVPRLPVEFKVYGSLFMNSGTVQNKFLYGGFGVSAVQTRGFYRFRPFYSAEVYFDKKIIETGVPVGLLIGCQLGNIFIGRFQFSPEISAGAKMLFVKPNAPPVFSGFALKGLAGFHFLVSRDIKLGFETGVRLDFDIMETESKNPLAAAFVFQCGITIK